MTKENDILLNVLANPTFGISDFKEIGLNSTNTSLESEEAYKNHSAIKENPLFKKEDGSFDNAKFHKYYQGALQYMNYIADDTYNDDFMKQVSYHRDNIFAPVSLRRQGPDFSYTKVSNPDRELNSIIRLGKLTEGKQSRSEIAQGLKVLTNPIECTRPDGTIDESKAKWEDAPGEGIFSSLFWRNFGKTRVMAQWDEDGEHIDPITGEKKKHSKGDLKLNGNGTYYYEDLDGRDVYGRQVLNKMDILTSEDSVWNKYDFFDSDDKKEKSAFGTLMKNLALVGSMYVPYVGPVIAGLSVATQTAGLLATFGKMLSGSDSPNLSAIEGWSKSLSRQGGKSEYAQQNNWCWENFIGLIGDTMAQFKEQRVLFQHAPALFKGKYGMSESGMKELEKKTLETLNKTNQAKMSELLEQGVKDINKLDRAWKELNAINSLKALSEIEAYMKGYNKLGELFSKTYMTGITVADTYGEAKNQGASDIEATMLTLGYGAAEAALLNTGLGEWLFPELRYNKMHQEAVARALLKAKDATKKLESGLIKKSLQNGEKELKKNYIKELFNIGKNAANDLWTASKSTGKHTLSNAFANASGEGFEEVSEELLADLSKGCFNVVSWLRNDDTKLEAFDTDWKNNGTTNWGAMFDRYAMNFLGGFIGGGLSGLSLDLTRAIKNLDHMSFDQGMLELIYMHRNGLIGDFLKTVDKMTLGNKYLSASKQTTNDNGEIVWEQASEGDNQDLAAKKQIKAQSLLIDAILTGNGIKISDDSFLKGLTTIKDDLKYAYLSHSKTAGRFLLEFNSLCADIIQKTVEVNGDVGEKTDEQKRAEKTLNTESTELESTDNSKDESKNKDSKKKKKTEPSTPSGNKITDAEKLNKDKAREELKELLKRKEALLKGERNAEFIQDALFEMTPAISDYFVKPSFIRYSEYKEGKSFEKIPTERRAELQELYKNYLNSEAPDDIHIASEIYRSMVGAASEIINAQTELYTANSNNDLINGINDFFKRGSYELTESQIQRILSEDPEQYLAIAQNAENKKFISFGNYVNNLFRNNGNESLRLQLMQLRMLIGNDATLTLQEKKTQLGDIDLQLTTLITDSIVDNVELIVDPYIRQGFINSEAKESLFLTLENAEINLIQRRSKIGQEIQSILDQHSRIETVTTGIDPEIVARYNNLKQLREILNNQINELKDRKEKINELQHSPIEKSLDEFALATTGLNFNITELLAKVNSTLADKRSELENFNLEGDVANQLDEAIKLCELYKLAIEGSKVDNGDADNLFGYTKTLNEVNKKLGNDSWEELAEIDSETAHAFIQDVDTLENKLKFAKTLYAINLGQKLNQLKRVSTNKNILFHKKVLKLITVIPDDWNGKDELQSVLDSFEVLKRLSQETKPNLSLSEEDLVKIEQESLLLEDSIYDFFLKNPEALKDPNKLSLLISVSKLDLYSIPTGILNEETIEGDINPETNEKVNNYLDDNSFVWWLATRAAVKASDFYNRYAQIIDIDPLLTDPIAPIPTQELATYTNYASVINGDVFSTFYHAFRNSIREDWKTKTKSEREVILADLDCSVDFADSKYDDYILTILPTLKFKNIVFTEGIPGSGKSTGVYKSTIKILTKFHSSDHILDNVIVVHGASKDSALEMVGTESNPGTLGLDSSKTRAMSYEEFMKYISGDWKKPNYHDGLYDVTDIKLSQEGEIVSSHTITNYNLNDSATLIIMDETTNFTMFDLLDIDNYASKYGIAVLSAGDTDQSGVVGKYTLAQDIGPFSKGDNDLVSIRPNNFIRTPKLGISMRTANSQKSYNLKAVQAFLQNPNGILNLHYHKNDQGLFGDEIYIPDTGEVLEYELEEGYGLVESIKLMFDTLKEGEKIGYIYDNKDSALYKYLTENYSDKITEYQGTSAQGKEGLYFIIELDSDGENYYKDLYTSITRAKQGSLIIGNSFNIESTEESSTMLEGTDKNAILRYSEKRKLILSNSTQNAGNIEYKKRTPINPSEDVLNPNQPTPNNGNGLTAPDVLNINFNQAQNNPSSNNSPDDELDTTNLTPPEERESIPYNAGSVFDEPNEEEVVENPSSKESDEFEGLTPPEEEEEIPTGLGSVFDSEVETTLTLDQGAALGSPQDEIFGVDIMPSEIREQQVAQESQIQVTPHTSSEQVTGLEALKFITPFYSFNTYETGVDIEADEHGLPILIGSSDFINKKRIDSVNGLINLDKKLGNNVRQLSEYIKIIGELRSVLIDYGNPTLLLDKLTKIMTKYFGTSAITCKFGFLSTIPGKEHTDNDFSMYERNDNDDLQFIYAKGNKSFEKIRKSIVATLGTSELGDIINLPLLTLTNPISIVNQVHFDGTPYYPDIYNLWDRDRTKNMDVRITDFMNKVVQQGLDKKYKSLLDLFTVFKDITNESYFPLNQGKDNLQWTIAKDLTSLGPLIIPNHKGLLSEYGGVYETEGFEYDSDFIDVSEFAKHPGLTVTPILYTETNELSNGSDIIEILKNHYKENGSTELIPTTNIINRGHPFVLYSYNNSVDKYNIYQQFLNQLSDSTLPKTVGMAYVLPPKASVSEYIDTIYLILSGNNAQASDIGNSFTAYTIIKALFKDLNFLDNVQYNRKEESLAFIKECLDEIELAELSAENKVKAAEAAYAKLIEVKSKPQLGFKNLVRGLFRKFLASMVYPSTKGQYMYSEEFAKHFKKPAFNLHNLDLIIDTLNKAGIDGVYFHAQGTKDIKHSGLFIELVQDRDGSKLKWGITDARGKFRPYLIHGKIDSNVFEADIQPILDAIIGLKMENSHMSTSEVTIWQGPYSYAKRFGHGTLTLTEDRIPLKVQSYLGMNILRESNIPLKPSLKKGLEKLGLTDLSSFENCVIQEQLNDLIDEAIKLFNLNHPNLIAFKSSDYIFVTDSNTLLQGPLELYSYGHSNPAENILSTFNLNNDGRVYFTAVNSLGIAYDCIYSQGKLEVTQKGTEHITQNNYSIDLTNIENILQGIDNSLILNSRYGRLSGAFDLTSLTTIANELILSGMLRNPDSFEKVLKKNGVDEITAESLRKFMEEIINDKNSLKDNCSIEPFNITVR